MTKCVGCGGKRFRDDEIDETLDVGGVRLKGAVPARVCVACKHATFAASDLQRFELSAARWLANHGVRSPVTFRFMRKVLGLRATELGELLDIAPETVSRWENGALPVEARAFALLGALVADRIEGRTDTTDRLRALRSPKAPPKRAQKIGLPRTA